MDAACTLLGELLGLPDEAAALAEYSRATYDRAVDIAGKVDKARLLYVIGPEGLNVIARDSFHSEVVDLMGDNLAVIEAPSSKGTGNEVDMEQILNWNPDVIIFQQDSIYATAADSPVWQEVAAIQSGRYYEVPFGPYNWVGFPPAAQQLLGLMWMPALLYPDAVDYDLYAEVARYFELFYHSELTRAQYDALVARSIGKE